MARARRPAPGPAIVLPDLIQGPWTSLIVLTYSANLAFFENHLLRQVSQVPLRLVLADDRRVAETLREAANTGQRLRNANRSYLIAPIRHPRAAHAKLMIMTAASAGRLLVGSGNLGQDGYASPGELWHAYAYDADHTQHLEEFAAARRLIDSLAGAGLLDPPVRDTLNAVWREAPWLAPTPTVDTSLRDNSAAPLAVQFIDAVRSLGEPVHELTVHAPFYDTDAGALRHLLDHLTPDRVRVLLRPDTSVDPKALTATLRAARSAQLFRLAVTGDEGTYIHAKWLHATTATHEVMLTGSANLSRPALLTTGSVGNLEAGILQTRARGGYDHLYQALTLTPLTNLEALDLHLAITPATPAVTRPVLLWSRLDGQALRLAFTTAFDETRLVLSASDGTTLATTAANWDDAHLLVRLTLDQAALLAEGGPLRATIDGDGQDGDAEATDVSWPYQLDHLAGRLKTVADNRMLDKVGALPEADKELYELLVQLEQTLIADQVSAWKVANPTSPVPTADGDGGGEGPSLQWRDIDWSKLKRSSQYLAYHYRTTQSLAHTDIEVILASISAQLTPEADRPSPGPSDSASDDDDLGVESGEVAADPDRAEELEADEDADELHRPLSVSTRTRMAFGRFVKRYRAALADVSFLQQLGPTVTVHNAVIMHHLLGRLLERDGIDTRVAADAYLAIWGLLWGDGTSPGILAGLDPAERAAADQLILQGKLREMTLQALASYAFDEELLDDLGAPLRRVAQQLAVDPDFDLTLPLCTAAAPRHAPELIADLWRLASRLHESEINGFVLGPLGLPASAARRDVATVNRRGAEGGQPRQATVHVLEILRPVLELTAADATDALGRLAIVSWFNDEQVDYWRIKFLAAHTLCFWDEAAGDGLVVIDGETTDLDHLDLPWPAWYRRYQELHEACADIAAA